MKLKPLFDRVIVEKEDTDTSKAGIFMGTKDENVQVGRVLFVGEGNEKNDGSLSKMFVKEGDRVVFSKFTAAEAEIEGKKVQILRQTDILAIIE